MSVIWRVLSAAGSPYPLPSSSQDRRLGSRALENMHRVFSGGAWVFAFVQKKRPVLVVIFS